MIKINDKFNLFTSRLSLRALKMSDLEDFYLYGKDFGVAEDAGWTHFSSIKDAEVMLKRLIGYQNVIGIAKRSDNKIIGTLSFDKPFNFSDKNLTKGLNGIEVGYSVGKKFQGYGVATEAVKEFIRYAFLDIDDIDYLSLRAISSNEKSVNVALKCGFIHIEDCSVRTVYGSYKPGVYMLIKKNDYKSNLEHVSLYDEKTYELKTYFLRGEKVPKGCLRGIVDCVVYNAKYDKYLVTKRSFKKNTFPGYFECPEGAITYPENELNSALREIYEEDGIKDIELSFCYKVRLGFTLSFVYFGITNVELDSVKMQASEVDEYYWLEKDEFLNRYNNPKFNPAQRKRIRKLVESKLK